MKRKFFTFLMAFLATVGNAVWAEGSGTQSDPWVIDLSNPQEIHNGALGMNEVVTLETSAIEIHEGGYYRVTGTTDYYHINIGYKDLLGALWYGPQGEDETVHLILDNVTMNSPSPLNATISS